MVDLFKALSEESRLRIVSLLIDRELCVCEMEACLNMTQSNVSRHLIALKSCGILASEKHAQWTYYRISERFVEENGELWEYLKRRLKELPTYQSDCAQCLKYQEQDFCGSQKRPH